MLAPVKPKAPILDLFIGRDGDAWRLYLAPFSWAPENVRRRMAEDRTVFPVAQPDADDLDQFMFDADAPYERRRTSDGGIEIVAKGRSAICLLVWLEDIVAPAPVTDRTTERRSP